jgi:PadR family transcriptional regulator, regulatory protein PadR
MTRLPNRSTQTLRLLAELLGSPRAWRHGYELSKATSLKSGTLYPILMRLADQGLLTSKWEESDGPGLPPRHVYRLTPDGLAYARDQAEGEAATLGAQVSKANS